MKLITSVNVILTITAVLLLINLLYPLKSVTAWAVYELDTEEPTCTFYNKEDSVNLNIEQCCYDIQNQLKCEKDQSLINCYTKKDSVKFEVNSKTFNYCKKQGFDIKLE